MTETLFLYSPFLSLDLAHNFSYTLFHTYPLSTAAIPHKHRSHVASYAKGDGCGDLSHEFRDSRKKTAYEEADDVSNVANYDSTIYEEGNCGYHYRVE